MGWWRRFVAWLRGLFRRPQPEPPTLAEARKPLYQYRVIVERPDQPEQTYRHSCDHAIQANEPIELASIPYVVVEVVTQAEPDGREGELRAKQAPPMPPGA